MMSVTGHEQLRQRRLARLLSDALGMTSRAAGPLAPQVPSIAADSSTSTKSSSSAFSATNMGDDQSPVSASAYVQESAHSGSMNSVAVVRTCCSESAGLARTVASEARALARPRR
jgi:hypothetical protein